MITNSHFLFVFQTFVPLAVNSALNQPAKAGSFIYTGPLNYARVNHAATLLTNGQVFVTGGGFGGTTELYDPGTRRWNLSNGEIVSASYQAATLLNHGQLLAAGGMDTSNNPLSFAGVENTATGL